MSESKIILGFGNSQRAKAFVERAKKLTLVRFSNPRIGFKPASGTLIIGYHEYPHRIISIEQLFSIIGKS